MGPTVDPRAGQITLNEYAETWMAAQVWRDQDPSHGPNNHFDNHIGPALGNRQLATITRTDVQAFVRRYTAKGLAPTTSARHHVPAWYQSSTAAVHDGKIVRSPAIKIQLPKPIKTAASQVRSAGPRRRAQHCRSRPAAHDGVCVVDRHRWTTTRRSCRANRRACQLPTEDHRRRPANGHAIERPGTHLAPTKTTASVRTVPINDSMVAELNRHMLDHRPVEIEPGATLIFTNSKGRPLRRNTFKWCGAEMRTALALPAEARGWHSLRHTYASALIHAGLS